MEPDSSTPGAPDTPGAAPASGLRPSGQAGPVTGIAKALAIIEGLGGPTNILEIEPCITRLRTEVRDGSLVSEAVLKSAGVHGVSRRGAIVQVIVGPEADVLAQDIEDQLR